MPETPENTPELEPARGHEKPPEDFPDEGGSTYKEDTPPSAEEVMKEDHGLSAGYPVVREDDIPSDPGLPKEEIKVPPPEARRGMPFFSAESMTPADPGDEQFGIPVNHEEVEADKPTVEKLIADAQMQSLWEKANTLSEKIPNKIYNLDLARNLLDMIMYGRNELMGGKEYFEEAERYINEVDYRVWLADKVREWTSKYVIWLFLYEVVFGATLLALLIYPLGDVAFASSSTLEQVGRFPPDLSYLVSSMIWGGFGGVISAIFALIKHTAREQDFDIQHNIWYIYSPLMGIGVGAAVFLFLRAGLLSLLGPGEGISSPIIIYILSLLSGYQHNVFTDIVRRMLQAFQVEEPSTKTPVITKQPPPSSKENEGE